MKGMQIWETSGSVKLADAALFEAGCEIRDKQDKG